MIIRNGTKEYVLIYFRYKGEKYKAEIESIWGLFLDIQFYKKRWIFGFIPDWKSVTGLNFKQGNFPNYDEYTDVEMIKMFDTYKEGDIVKLNRLNEEKLKTV